MEPQHETLYLISLFKHLNSAMIAYRSLREAASISEVDDVMMEAHSMVVHAMGASRLLWPNIDEKKKGAPLREERGAHLRKVLGIPDDHGLKNSARLARNRLEHFDERLDGFVRSLDGELIVMQGLNAVPTSQPARVQVRHYDRDATGTRELERVLSDFNTYSKRLTVVDVSIDLGDLSKQVMEVGTMLNRVFVDRFLAAGGAPEDVGPGFPDWSVTTRFRDRDE